MVKIGIIGCGKIAKVRHIPEYYENPMADLYGFYDLNKERAQALAKKFNGKAYDSYEALLDDDQIDAVSILTPNVTHCEIAVAAMRAGKDVLCEKPMATTKEQCEKMIKVMQETGRKLAIAQNQRLTLAHRKARELIEAGEIGTVLSFRTTFSHGGTDSWSIDGKNSWFTDKKRSCFGALADLGIHKTDLMVYLLGENVKQVSAIIRTLDKKDAEGNFIEVDDNAFCTFIMESGAVGTMNAGWTNYGEEDNSTSIYGTKGALHLYKDKTCALVLERSHGERQCWDMDEIQTNENQTKSGVIDAFIDCITKNKEPEISAQSVMPAMNALFACGKSNEEAGTLVEVS